MTPRNLRFYKTMSSGCFGTIKIFIRFKKFKQWGWL